MKKLLHTLFLFIAFIHFATAQNVVFEETFNAGLPDNWSSITLQGDGSASADWIWTNFGPMGGFSIGSLQSTTAGNGWMIYDSDLNCSGQNQEAWLVAPRQDASGLTQVFLSFETFYASFNDRPTVEVSTDSMNWTSIEVFPGIGANDFGGDSNEDNPQTISIDLSDIVAGESTYWIAFRFLSDSNTGNGGDGIGCAYSWQIDDVKILDGDSRPANDLDVSSSFYAIAPNALTPASQVETFGFLADINNLGAQEQTNVMLNIQISEVGSGDVVFSDNATIDFIGVDSVVQDVTFDTEFLPADEIVTYEGTYSVTFGNQDANPLNNQRDFFFSVSDTIFSKWFDNPALGISPAADDSYAYGNCYFIPNGNGFYGRYVTFGVSNANELAGRTISILTYRWDGDTNQDLLASADEYGNGPISFNTYTFDGTETDLITVPMSEDEIGIPLEDETYYFTVIQYDTDDAQAMSLLGSQEYDYTAMYVQSLLDGSPRYASILDVGNTGEFDLVGFGFDIVPVVDISVSVNPDLVSATLPTLSKDNKIEAYPNPSDEFVTLDFDLVKAQDVAVRFIDIKGRVLQFNRYDQLKTGTFTFPLDQFSAGTYFFYVEAEEGARTLKITVQ